MFGSVSVIRFVSTMSPSSSSLGVGCAPGAATSTAMKLPGFRRLSAGTSITLGRVADHADMTDCEFAQMYTSTELPSQRLNHSVRLRLNPMCLEVQSTVRVVAQMCIPRSVRMRHKHVETGPPTMYPQNEPEIIPFTRHYSKYIPHSCPSVLADKRRSNVGSLAMFAAMRRASSR
jgi:hypothetical protein